LNFETSPLLKWQIIGGYGIRDYDRPDLKNTAIGLLQGRVTWLPTQLLTIYGTASRKFDDAVFENAIGGKTDNTIEVSANYEALRNLIFTITGKYTKSDYVESARKDNIMAAGLRMTYMHTKNWNFTAGYEYAQRTSNTYDGDISRNRFIFSAKLRF